MTEPHSTAERAEEEIDLSSIFALLWQRRRLIVLGTLGATLLSIGVSLLFSRVYRSEGFYQLGNPTKKIIEKKTPSIGGPEKKTPFIGVPVPLYKSSSTQFNNPNNLLRTAGRLKAFGEEELARMSVKFKTAADISKWLKPVYAFSKEDARDFTPMVAKEDYNTVIGLNLSFEADSPEKASATVAFFGDYVRDCLFYLTLYNYVMQEYTATLAEAHAIENEIISIQFELDQNTAKMKDIQAIITKYPKAAELESRQLVSVQEGGARYLAPITQLVGIESALADHRRSLVAKEHERERLSIRSEYFSRCHNEMPKAGELGEALFLMLQSIKDQVFRDKDRSRDDVKEVLNNLNIDLQSFEHTFNSNSRFISGPTVPDVHIKPRRSLIVITVFLVSFFSLVLVALILGWWQSNKKKILSPG